MQIKNYIEMLLCYSYVRMVKIQKPNHTKFCWGFGGGKAWALLVGIETVQPLWNMVCHLLKVKCTYHVTPFWIRPTCWPKRNKRIGPFKNLYSNEHGILFCFVFIIIPTWKQLKYLSIEECINNYRVSIQWNTTQKTSRKLLIHPIRKINLQVITLSKRSQT